jgi:hypothetical protein
LCNRSCDSSSDRQRSAQARRRGRVVVRAIVLASALIPLSATTASAQWFIAPFLGVKFAAETSFTDPDQGASNSRLTIGAAAGYIGSGILGVEGEVAYYPRFFERSSGTLVNRRNVTTMMGNVIVTVPRDWTGYALRPYASGGAGYMHIGIDTALDVFNVDADRLAFNVGGGAVGGLTATTAVRFDLRFFKSPDRDDEANVGIGPTSLSFWRATVGITIR